MSKAKFTEADVRRAVKGVLDGGGRKSRASKSRLRWAWYGLQSKRKNTDLMDPENDPGGIRGRLL